ncbi:hypothetical protein Vretimale_335 [Volvox reticuliferus]|uniref:peptidylprolyl isomerase n=1 Tax=Volvox reticuliferus TaxID=1737510 RepID=A0A8J4D3B0_9CHLO|nr:hypothetical protein Vretifemale_2556 [Volvox reticuliferus]GIL94170.1 hypothetical protein Vretimale_335 [Volvox reticuliferus]
MVELEKAITTNPVVDNQILHVEEDACDRSGAESEPVGDSDEPSADAAANGVPTHVSLTPPEDCIAVTEDRGVLKKVLEPGESDDKPSLHARCLIHYVGYLASSGEVFMDTRNDKEQEEPAVVVAGRTAAALETGLCLAAATMSKGERALVFIQDPAYGYGALGSFSFPCVPPNSQLVYEVHMINWEGVEETDNDRDRGSLLFEERLERAERRREAGNRAYLEEKYKEALAKYALALSYMDEDFMYQLEGHYLDKAEAVKLRVHLNMAAAQLKTGDYNTAIYNCGQVLNIDPQNVKALFRRGRARHALGRTEEARQDLEAALKLSPTDPDIIKEMHSLKATQKQERLAQEALFRDKLKSSAVAETGILSGQQQEQPQGQQQPAAFLPSTAATTGGDGSVKMPPQQLTKRAAPEPSSTSQKPPGGCGAGGVSEARVGTQSWGKGLQARVLEVLALLWALIVGALGGTMKRRQQASQKSRVD